MCALFKIIFLLDWQTVMSVYFCTVQNHFQVKVAIPEDEILNPLCGQTQKITTLNTHSHFSTLTGRRGIEQHSQYSASQKCSV